MSTKSGQGHLGSDPELSTRMAVAHYGKRFSTEENFSDTKNLRFWMGLSHTNISRPERRDRIFLINALAVAFLTLLGAAGEPVGIDSYFKANTVKKRVHFLFRQGCMYYDFLANMREEWAVPLLVEFERLLAGQPFTRKVLGIV